MRFEPASETFSISLWQIPSFRPFADSGDAKRHLPVANHQLRGACARHHTDLPQSVMTVSVIEQMDGLAFHRGGHSVFSQRPAVLKN